MRRFSAHTFPDPTPSARARRWLTRRDWQDIRRAARTLSHDGVHAVSVHGVRVEFQHRQQAQQPAPTAAAPEGAAREQPRAPSQRQIKRRERARSHAEMMQRAHDFRARKIILEWSRAAQPAPPLPSCSVPVTPQLPPPPPPAAQPPLPPLPPPQEPMDDERAPKRPAARSSTSGADTSPTRTPQAKRVLLQHPPGQPPPSLPPSPPSPTPSSPSPSLSLPLPPSLAEPVAPRFDRYQPCAWQHACSACRLDLDSWLYLQLPCDCIRCSLYDVAVESDGEC